MNSRTPTRAELANALDQLTDSLLGRREVEFSEAVQTWFGRGYRCADVPSPPDTGTRLALKACILERLVEVLNSPPHRDRQSVPTWCLQVPGIKQPMPLQSKRLLEDELCNETFRKRNFLVTGNFMYFV